MKTKLKLLMLGFLVTVLPKLSTGQTSIGIPTSEKKIWNVVSQSFENCKSENLFLVSTLDTCKVALQSANEVIRSKNAVIDIQERLIGNLQYTTKIQSKVIDTDKLILKEQKKGATLKTIGFTVGGFGVGLLVPVLIIIFK